jgi:L-threonylcarbamoyladenylate synthase
MLEIEVATALTEGEREEAARQAAAVLGAGGLVIHPTETVYGVGGDGSTRNNALISRIKRRAAAQPLILLALNAEAAEEFLPGLVWPAALLPVAQRFWPGPLTVVVPCDDAPEGLRGPGGGVAIRVTPDPTVRAILRAWRRPMTSTSANLTGGAPARSLQAALKLLERREDLDDLGVPALGIDAGPSVGERPSTIVSFVESPPRLVREGPVPRGDLARWIEDLK